MAEPTSRREVYRVIDGERNYQEWRWPGHKHSATEFLVYIDHYVKQGMLLVSTQNGESGALGQLRKIAALAVAAMEQNGAIERAQWPSRQIGEAERNAC